MKNYLIGIMLIAITSCLVVAYFLGFQITATFSTPFKIGANVFLCLTIVINSITLVNVLANWHDRETGLVESTKSQIKELLK